MTHEAQYRSVRILGGSLDFSIGVVSYPRTAPLPAIAAMTTAITLMDFVVPVRLV